MKKDVIDSIIGLVAFDIDSVKRNHQNGRASNNLLSDKTSYALSIFLDYYHGNIRKQQLFDVKSFNCKMRDFGLVTGESEEGILIRVVYLLNKYHHMKYVLMLLGNNVRSISSYLEELELSFGQWMGVSVLSKDGNRLDKCDITVPNIVSKLQRAYEQYVHEHHTEISRILEHCPTWLLELSIQKTEKKTITSFKKRFAKDAVSYLNRMDQSKNNKYRLLGLCFVQLGFSLNTYDHRSLFRKRHKLDEYKRKDHYQEYLRNEGKNYWKSCANTTPKEKHLVRAI